MPQLAPEVTISLTARPAPSRLHSMRNGRSVTPAIGATNRLFGKSKGPICTRVSVFFYWLLGESRMSIRPFSCATARIVTWRPLRITTPVFSIGRGGNVTPKLQRRKG